MHAYIVYKYNNIYMREAYKDTGAYEEDWLYKPYRFLGIRFLS